MTNNMRERENIYINNIMCERGGPSRGAQHANDTIYYLTYNSKSYSVLLYSKTFIANGFVFFS